SCLRNVSQHARDDPTRSSRESCSSACEETDRTIRCDDGLEHGKWHRHSRGCRRWNRKRLLEQRRGIDWWRSIAPGNSRSCAESGITRSRVSTTDATHCELPASRAGRSHLLCSHRCRCLLLLRNGRGIGGATPPFVSLGECYAEHRDSVPPAAAPKINPWATLTESTGAASPSTPRSLPSPPLRRPHRAGSRGRSGGARFRPAERHR